MEYNLILKGITEELENIEDMSINELKGDTALIIVDMVKGFYNVGNLASHRTGRVISNIILLNEELKSAKKLCFIDSHMENAIEFKSYPIHCIEGSEEEELIDEIKEIVNKDNYKIIKKNSINGFHAKEFLSWLKENDKIKNFIVTGVCTNICVEAFCISLKTYFNEYNIDKNVIVPMYAVETYDYGLHNGDLMNLLSFYKMKQNGITIVNKFYE